MPTEALPDHMLPNVLPIAALLLLGGCQAAGNVSEFKPSSAAASQQNASVPGIVLAADTSAGQVPVDIVRSDAPLNTFKIERTAYAGEADATDTPLFTSLIPTNYSAPVPTYLPGVKLINTYDLHRTLSGGSKQPLLINTLAGTSTEVIEGSVWLSGSGQYGRMDDEIQFRLEQHLQSLTGGDKRRKIVFYCAGTQCWASFNASLRALVLGYKNVQWYRGGLVSWYSAGLPTQTTSADQW